MLFGFPSSVFEPLLYCNYFTLYFTSKFKFAFVPESKPAEVVESAMMETDAAAADDASTSVVKLETTVDQLSPDKQAQQSTIEKLTQILSGTKSIYFHLQVNGRLSGLRLTKLYIFCCWLAA